MMREQCITLIRLIRVYLGRVEPDIARATMRRIEGDGMGGTHFAWAGSHLVGAPHYYRVQAGAFLIEYDNTQNDANHIHSVWRDSEGDFGRDLLAEHYEAEHGGG